jgi:hypothetical protein
MGSGGSATNGSKKGAFLHRRLVAVGERGISVRKLGGSRAGEMRITRFLRNPKVSADAIFADAAGKTAARVRGLHVLAIQDTTALRDDGAGRSLQAHPTLAVDAETGALLGLAHGEILSRAGGAKAKGSARPLVDKESRRWLSGAEAAGRLKDAGALAVTVVADREADLYELFAHRPEGVEVLVRARHDRSLADGGKAFGRLAAADPLGTIEVELAAAPGRRARTARLELRSLPAQIERPAYLRGAGAPERLAVTLVEARELDPPAGASPALWRLVTTHAAASLAEASWIAGLYRRRWIIEELARTLKTRGFDIERVTVEDAPFEVLAAAAVVAAASVLALVQDREGRGKRPLTDVFTPDDRPALEAVSASLEGKTAKQKNPHPPASLAFAAWVCARLGGWTGYYGKPGPVVMLNGLHQFRAIQKGWSLRDV